MSCNPHYSHISTISLCVALQPNTVKHTVQFVYLYVGTYLRSVSCFVNIKWSSSNDLDMYCIFALYYTAECVGLFHSVLLLEHDQSKVLTLLFISISQKRLELDYMHYVCLQLLFSKTYILMGEFLKFLNEETLTFTWCTVYWYSMYFVRERFWTHL